jgi:site-specific DNA-methyltransferase (adenine-specific)
LLLEKSIAASAIIEESIRSLPLIKCGDSQCAELFPNDSVDAIIGSPPYNVGMAYPTVSDSIDAREYFQRCQVWLKNCHGWSKDGGRLAVVVPVDVRRPHSMPLGAIFSNLAMAIGWRYETSIIWAEGSHNQWFLPSDPPLFPGAITCPDEIILIFSKNPDTRKNPGRMPDIDPEEYKEWINGRWNIAGAHAASGHPCPYPAEIPRRLIKLLTYPGESVLDPWMGSGTTVLEAVKLGRVAMGADVEPTYFEMTRKRVAKSLAEKVLEREAA